MNVNVMRSKFKKRGLARKQNSPSRCGRKISQVQKICAEGASSAARTTDKLSREPSQTTKYTESTLGS